MGKNTISVLVMLSCTLFAVCRANRQEYIAIEKALRSLSNVVVKYKSEFDTKVKFVELQKAIDAIDDSMLDYVGTAKDKLDELRALNSAARQTYQDCVGPVFEWCVSINSTLDLFIPYISDPSLSPYDKDIIWEMTVDALSDGQKKTYNSLELLKSVQKKTIDLKNLLDAVLHDLHNDFGPNGFYGKRKQELMNAIVESQKSRQALIIAGVISLIFGAIAAFVIGPVGVKLDLLQVFVPLGLEEVIRRQRQATYEEELQVIQTFFNILDEKINNASTIATQVDADLEEDKNNLYVLSGLISAAERNKKMLLMNSPIMRARLVPSFRNLGNKCYEYTMWHGYGSEEYEHIRHKRVRRHASETCKAQRLKAMTMITRSIPLNSTFETIVSKAHSILSEMNCESKNLPMLSPNEQNAAVLRSAFQVLA
ncbi:uncharacterized protein LOC100677902 [Nasonia vitripennis]|uniref:Odorant receptor n=1 Tax=Nasonia vitripennis TaxID=7425 RepID=A0A7M7GCK9_NASVI|nr:uncharacterized protein LOC100677902 [Nasonia vitripennis]